MTELRQAQHTIEHSIQINAAAATVWRHITAVDLAAFRHPACLAWLGIPKPLRWRMRSI